MVRAIERNENVFDHFSSRYSGLRRYPRARLNYKNAEAATIISPRETISKESLVKRPCNDAGEKARSPVDEIKTNGVYKKTAMRHNGADFRKVSLMGQSKNKNESRLQELILTAKQMNIEVRTEKLLREVGYRARSGRCRVKGREFILLDKDTPLSEQVDFLAAELAERKAELEPSQS
jgi:hypothetical protein